MAVGDQRGGADVRAEPNLDSAERELAQGLGGGGAVRGEQAYVRAGRRLGEERFDEEGLGLGLRQHAPKAGLGRLEQGLDPRRDLQARGCLGLGLHAELKVDRQAFDRPVERVVRLRLDLGRTLLRESLHREPPPGEREGLLQRASVLGQREYRGGLLGRRQAGRAEEGLRGRLTGVDDDELRVDLGGALEDRPGRGKFRQRLGVCLLLGGVELGRQPVGGQDVDADAMLAQRTRDGLVEGGYAEQRRRDVQRVPGRFDAGEHDRPSLAGRRFRGVEFKPDIADDPFVVMERLGRLAQRGNHRSVGSQRSRSCASSKLARCGTSRPSGLRPRASRASSAPLRGW